MLLFAPPYQPPLFGIRNVSAATDLGRFTAFCGPSGVRAAPRLVYPPTSLVPLVASHQGLMTPMLRMTSSFTCGWQVFMHMSDVVVRQRHLRVWMAVVCSKVEPACGPNPGYIRLLDASGELSSAIRAIDLALCSDVAQSDQPHLLRRRRCSKDPIPDSSHPSTGG